MLDLVDETLEAMFRAGVPLSAQDVDVSFEAPEEEWSAKLNRPTVNVYLWEVRRSTARAKAGTEVVERSGVLTRRMALPRVELQYLVTVWTSDHGDERALLAGLMRTVLGLSEIPRVYLPAALAELPPLTLALARAEERDLFNLSDRLKLGLNLVVTSAVETDAGIPVGPPVTAFDVQLRDRDGSSFDRPPRRVAGEVLDPSAVGAAVTTPRGRSTVNPTGRFLVPAAPGDEVTLHTDPIRTAVVPAEGGIVFT